MNDFSGAPRAPLWFTARMVHAHLTLPEAHLLAQLQVRLIRPEERARWEQLLCERHVWEGDATEPRLEVVFGLSSLDATDGPPARLLGLAREHWGAIENGHHHRRDRTYREDFGINRVIGWLMLAYRPP